MPGCCRGVAGVLRRGAGVRAQTGSGTLASIKSAMLARPSRPVAAAAQEKARRQGSRST